MNGLLSALLGGASGAGQGLQYQDERAQRLEQLRLAQSAQDLEKAKMRADLFMQGFDPDNGPPIAPAGAMSAPSAPGAPSPMASPTAPPSQYIPSGYGGGGPRPTTSTALPPAPPLMGGPRGGASGSPGAMPGMDAIRAAAQSQAPSASAPSAPSPFGAFAATDGQSLDLPGIGHMTYNFGRSPLARQAMMAAITKRMETDEKIRESGATGATAKNVREASRLQLGDPNYAQAMGQVASSEAMARLGADIQKARAEGSISLANGQILAQVHGAIQGQLQQNQQQFEMGKMTAQQKFEKDQEAVKAAASFANQLGLKQWEEGGSPVSRVTRGMFGAPAPTSAPSQQVAPVQSAPQAPAPKMDARKPDLAMRVQQLQSSGMSKDQARQQLLREGYDLTGKR